MYLDKAEAEGDQGLLGDQGLPGDQGRLQSDYGHWDPGSQGFQILKRVYSNYLFLY